ncbi:MAG: LamG domain-containing protein, partial [SAR202 cluster bacterium]|nr:LamG domain-containing protein [SAR202 cluster bacterium]
GMGSAGVAAADAIIDFLGGGSTLDSLLGRSAFDYALQSSEADHHSGLAQVTLDWTNNTEVFQIEGLFPLSGPGINQNQSIVLSESLNVPVIECWGFIVQYCEVDKLKDTFHSSLSDSFSFDVLPTSLNGFVNLAGGANGYRMSWDSRFPILVDADGDGLPSRASGGSDPDDGDWDTDDDGLSDYWETNNGFDPTSDDPDGDLLTDYWEAFYGTDQLRTDSDADGLVDGEEFFHSGATHPFGDDGSTWTGGWTIVYEYDSTDEPQRTLVSADALDYDGDQDTIIDKLEKVYRYNPNVSDELNVLSLQADIQSPDSALEGYVAPGAAVSYTATVKNELDIPTARGLLESEFPVDVEQTTQTFVLASREEITLTDDALTAPDVAETTVASVVVRAGAVLEDPDAVGETPLERRLWLKMNERASFDWERERTFVDSSGWGHDATCEIDLPGDFANKKCPEANGMYLTFDGQEDPEVRTEIVIDAISHNDFNLDEFSVSMWVLPTGQKAVHQHLLNKPLELVIGINENSMQPFAGMGYDCSSNTRFVNGTKNLNQNQWNHLATTYDGTNLTLYVNGQNAGALRNPSSCLGHLNSQIYIGGFAHDYIEGDLLREQNIGYVFEGGIDDVSLYAGALGSEEVFEMFDAGLRVMELKFDDPPGAETFEDSSGNGGTIMCFLEGYCPESGRPDRDNQAVSIGEQPDDFFYEHTYLTTPLFDLAAKVLNRGGYTVMVWVKGRDFSEKAHIFGLTMTVNASGSPGFSSYHQEDEEPISSVVLDTDVWYHLAWRWDDDAGERAIFVNGIEVANTTTADRP